MKKSFFGATSLIMLLIFSYSTAAAKKSPKKVYKNYNHAILAGKFNIAMSYRIKADRQQIKKMKQSQKKQTFQMLKKMAPKKYKITKQKITGKKAYILLKFITKTEITDNNKTTSKTEKMYSKVDFIKERGKWKIAKEHIQDKPFSK